MRIYDTLLKVIYLYSMKYITLWFYHSSLIKIFLCLASVTGKKYNKLATRKFKYDVKTTKLKFSKDPLYQDGFETALYIKKPEKTSKLENTKILNGFEYVYLLKHEKILIWQSTLHFQSASKEQLNLPKKCT